MKNKSGDPVKESPDQIKDELATPSADYIKMDYNLETAEERVEKTKEIIANTPLDKLTPKYLDKMADYITEPITKEEKKQQKILTKNRMSTINKRETSFEGLVGKLENGEDGIYNMITNDKNIIFQHKNNITNEEVQEIAPLKELKKAIEDVKEMKKHARGKKAFALGNQLIEMHKDQYEIRKSYKPVIYSMNLTKSTAKLNLSEKIIINEKGQVESDGIVNLFDEKHISIILCNYSKLKEDNWDKLQNDMKWMIEDLEYLVDKTLKDNYPMYYDLLIYKIDGKQNSEIQELLFEDYGIKHSVEYISSLWRNKIPKMIAETAVNEYLIWYYTIQEYGKWKRCSRCGQIKLAHNNFFSKNSTSKDGWYSICKQCRNKKPNQKKVKKIYE